MSESNININILNSQIDEETTRKMSFIYKAIHDGWAVNLENDKYVFIKKHNGKKEVFEEEYLLTFIKSNSSF
jgi:hypothetical protein